MCASDGQVTLLLKAMNDGDGSAAEKLLPLVYSELHRLAASYMRRERADHTLQPTALINEAYLRLAHEGLNWESHQHFVAVAANIMRRVLVDHARAHNANMRGGDLHRVELEEGLAISPRHSDEVLALHDALNQLEKHESRQARIVELRYFAGLSVEEIASLMNLSPRSVKRDWALARVWLFREIQGPRPAGTPQD
jgi:RNA polymerase sigma-70 factor (ECF subfamily)